MQEAVSSHPKDVLQPLLPVLCSPDLLGYSQGSMSSILVLINLLGSVRSMFQELGKFEKIRTNSKGPEKFTGALRCFPFLHPRWLYINYFFFLVIVLIMLEFLAQTDKMIPDELFTWTSLN